MKSLKTILALIPLIIFAGCRQASPPDPSMTAVGGTGAGQYSDWINPADVDRANALGLSMRDSSFGEGGEHIEGLLPSVYFDFDQSFIRPADRPALQQAADHLIKNQGDRLLIEGHCDWRGTTEYNMTLGDRRASSVKDYLVNIGVPAERIETVSKGDLEAITEASEDQMQQDRRADLVVIR